MVSRLKAAIEAMPSTAGYLIKDCQTVLTLTQKIEQKYKTIRPRNQADIESQVESTAIPVPTEDDIGYLINISVGHTQRPIDAEMQMIALHLKEAGFTDPKRSNSPARNQSLSQLSG